MTARLPPATPATSPIPWRPAGRGATGRTRPVAPTSSTNTPSTVPTSPGARPDPPRSTTVTPRLAEEQGQADDRHHRLRPLPRFPHRRGAGGGDRAHLAHARPSRDFLALHVQPRMGRDRALVRQVHRAGDPG